MDYNTASRFEAGRRIDSLQLYCFNAATFRLASVGDRSERHLITPDTHVPRPYRAVARDRDRGTESTSRAGVE
jgi:hypothetical protein